MSLTVLPPLIPSICVCTAPAMPTVHKSLLLLFILGDIALGGGLLTVVFVSPFVVTVLLDVLSVIIGSAAWATVTEKQNNIANKTRNVNFDLPIKLNTTIFMQL